MEPRSTAAPSSSAKKPSKWGSAGWWSLAFLSIPFSIYAGMFVSGDFDTYRKYTLHWSDGNHALAGVNIRDHIWAWQIHSLGAQIYIFTGLCQFSTSFRKKFPAIHRQMGYAFVAVGATMAISGTFFMDPYSEFNTVGRTTFVLQGAFMLGCLFVAVKAAREKKFRLHQQFMIRAAATGYSFIAIRILIYLFAAAGINFWVAAELAAVVSPVLCVSVAEIYIQTELKWLPTGRATRKIRQL